MTQTAMTKKQRVRRLLRNADKKLLRIEGLAVGCLIHLTAHMCRLTGLRVVEFIKKCAFDDVFPLSGTLCPIFVVEVNASYLGSMLP